MAFVGSKVLQPDVASAGDLALSNLADAADYISGRCLADTTVGAVGLEMEALCFDLRDPARRPSWQELSDTIAGLPMLPAGARSRWSRAVQSNSPHRRRRTWFRRSKR